MPAPLNEYRYLGRVTRPSGVSDQELFKNLRDAKREIADRHRTGIAVVYTFAYSEMGVSVDLDSISAADVADRLEPGTTVDLYQVHRDGNIEPNARYRLTLGDRGGVSSVRLKEGVHPA